MGLRPFPQVTCLPPTWDMDPVWGRDLGSPLVSHLRHFPRLKAIVLLSVLTSTTILQRHFFLSYNSNIPLVSSDFREEKSQDALVLNNCCFFLHDTNLLWGREITDVSQRAWRGRARPFMAWQQHKKYCLGNFAVGLNFLKKKLKK